ncbi:hypothetical protein JOM56_004765 [Amanita muscaria]
MPFSTFFFDAGSQSNLEQSPGASEHLIQPENTYKWFAISFCNWFCRPKSHAQVVAQFQDAHGVNISGTPRFTNIGVNHNVNFYGGTHGLENLKEFASFAALHDSSAQDPDRRCHPGTRENVMKRMRDWIDNSNPTDRILWVNGPAGAGKSAIAQTIAHAYNQGEVAATFFFYRSDAGRNDGNRLFPTIAWQLAFSIPATKNHIVRALNKSPHLPMKGVETQFEQLVAHPFLAMNNVSSHIQHPAPVIIIDGVDECTDEKLQRRFLNAIGNAVRDGRVPLRFLISSRSEALIEETLNQFQDFTLRINLATLEDANRDIEKYLRDQFFLIASKQGLDPSWPGQEIIQEVVFKSSGNFIFAFLVVKFVGDEDYSAESQLDIIRNLKPRGTISPFALLDELYLEILKRQLDQGFLKDCLALLIARSSIRPGTHRIRITMPEALRLLNASVHTPVPPREDDAMLLNVSEKELRIKLRRMRSLLKFEPFIDVYHQSFLDYLQDPYRSGLYNIIIRHVSMAIEQPYSHDSCRFNPEFKAIVTRYPSEIVLLVEDWQEALKPLLNLQNKLLNMPNLVLVRGNSHRQATSEAPWSIPSTPVGKWSPFILTEKTVPERTLDSCLSSLFSHLQNMDSTLAVSATIINLIPHLLTFNHAEVASKVDSVSDAQKLIDLIDLVTNTASLLSQYGTNVARKAVYLASEIFRQTPVLPQSLFLNRSSPDVWSPGNFKPVELLCQSALIGRILDHDYVISLLGIYYNEDEREGRGFRFVSSMVTEQNLSLSQWLERSNPSSIARIRMMLEIAKIIQYIHSMGITLDSNAIQSECFSLDSNLRPRIRFSGAFAWWVRDASIYDHEAFEDLELLTNASSISAFASLFHKVCFQGGDTLKQRLPMGLHKDARQLILRCSAKDWESRPTMDQVVKEMEKWDLSTSIDACI